MMAFHFNNYNCIKRSRDTKQFFLNKKDSTIYSEFIIFRQFGLENM